MNLNFFIFFIFVFSIANNSYAYEQYNNYFNIKINFKNEGKKIYIKITPKEDYKFNRNFPSKIYLKGKKIEFNKSPEKKYTRNEFKTFFDSILIIEDKIKIKAKLFYFNMKGSIGICSDEFCKKIDINKNFRIKQGVL